MKVLSFKILYFPSKKFFPVYNFYMLKFYHILIKSQWLWSLRGISKKMTLGNTSLAAPRELSHCPQRRNATTPLKFKMAARGPQNWWRGLERCLSFGALLSTFAKCFFWSVHSVYEKRLRQRKIGRRRK